MNSEIKELIEKYKQEGDFNHATVTDVLLVEAEEKLGVTLPIQYKEYIKEYGHGGIAGIEILGVGLTGRLIFVDTTLEYREEGLPDNYVVVENVDEWLMCIDCNNGKVISWDFTGYSKEDYDSFDEYLLDQMKNAIENL